MASHKLLVLAFLLSWSIQPHAAEARPSNSDSTLTFRGTRITLANGEVFRSDMVRITQDSLVMHGSRYLPAEALIQLRSSDLVASHELSDIAEIEVLRSYAGAGAGLGFLGGVIAFLGWVSSSESTDTHLSAAEAALGVAIFGGAGAGIGAVAGSFFHHWETIYKPGTDLDQYRIRYRRGVGYDVEAPSPDK